MKKLIIPSVIAVAAVMLSFTLFDSLPIGSAMPKADKKLKDISGKEISLKDAKKENGLLVMFSCNTCPFVIKNQDRTKEICTYAQSKNIGVVVLNSNEAYRASTDSYEEMKVYANEQGYKWNYAVDDNSELADAFGANRTPEVYLFNKDLKLVYHGAIDNNPSDASSVTRKHLQIAIDETVEGKAVSTSETKSVGCGIKRKS
ncbi:MAG: thioredoxin family protein [Bacteroidota bacterium]